MFSNGYFLLNDIPRLGKAFEIDIAQILTLCEKDQQIYNAEDCQHAQNIEMRIWKSFAPILLINHFDVWNWNVYWCSISWNKLWLKINNEMQKMIGQANGKSSHFLSYCFYLKNWMGLEANTQLWSSPPKTNVQNYLRGG